MSPIITFETDGHDKLALSLDAVAAIGLQSNRIVVIFKGNSAPHVLTFDSDAFAAGMFRKTVSVWTAFSQFQSPTSEKQPA